MAFTKPVGWSVFRIFGDAATYVKTGHTSAAPRTVSIVRAEAKGRAQPAQAVTSYRVRYVAGLLDGDGIPVPPKHQVSLDVRRAVSYDPASLDADLQELGTLLEDAGFRASLVSDLTFPTV